MPRKGRVVHVFSREMLSDWLKSDGDAELLPWLGTGLLAVMAFSSFLAFFDCLRVPYGRYGDQRGSLRSMLLTSFKVPARLAWMVQEMPSVIVPLYLVLNAGGRYVGAFNPNVVLLGMFLLHYVNRTFLYGSTLRGRKTPLVPAVVAFCFCTINGYLQSRYLTNYVHYEFDWFYDPRFLLGHLLFLLGMAVNVHSDSVLQSLRAPGETGYKIPHGGLFEYVSCANYLGESLEWTGYAIACWTPVATQFCVSTYLFLGSRALQHHRFYQEKFEDYPKTRRAFIPFLL